MIMLENQSPRQLRINDSFDAMDGQEEAKGPSNGLLRL